MSIHRLHLRSSARVPILQIALIMLLMVECLSAPSRISAAATPLPRTDLWVPNTSVSTAIVDGNTLYIGGGFTIVGPSTGNSALLDPISAAPDLSWPKVAGQVFTIVDDGSGGWFIGGAFTAVAGAQRQRIAHMLSDGTLDPSWQPSVDGTVWTMVRDGTTLYIGGEFSNVDSTGRNSLAALSTADGSLISSWNPAPSLNSSILAMDLDGTNLYVGGYFSTIGGQSIQNLARVNTATGAADAAWAPNPDGGLRSLLVSDTSVYAGGQYLNISGVPRAGLAQLSTSAGAAASAWTPNPDNSVWALALDGTTLYVGGSYTTIASSSRERLASFDLSGGSPALTNWNPDASALVMALTVADDQLYVAGSFTTIGSAGRRYLAAFDLATDSPVPTTWNPGASDQTRSVVAASGGHMLVGGDFTSIGGVVRNRLAAIDLTTGEPTSWAPDVSAVVIAMKKSGTTLYVGGYFTSIGGVVRNRLAAFDTTTGNLLSWAPSVDSGNISTLEADVSRVYAGGSFSSIDGTTRNNLAAFDASTGALDPTFDPNLSDQVDAMSLNAGILYVLGYFSSASGTARDKLAAFDTSSGSLTSWNPGLPGGSPADILAADNAIYVAGSFSTIGVGGAARTNLAALDHTTGVATAWNPNVNGHVNTVTLVDGRIYVGGSFTQVDGETRERLAEIDPAATASGDYVLSWNPGANSVPNVVVPAGSGVYVGGSFYRIANRAASFSALFTDPPMTAPTAGANAATDVGPISATLNGTVNASNSSTTVSFEWGTTAGGPYPNNSPALPSTVTGSADTAVSAGIAGLTPETTYYYSVVATNGGGTARSSERSFTTAALVAGTAPSITSVPVTKIGLGRAYSYTVIASGSPVPSFQLDGSPPAGMVINATTGMIRWTPATVGNYQITVRAANGVLPEATQTFTIVVRYEVVLPMVAR
jgi:hypothetical protein